MKKTLLFIVMTTIAVSFISCTRNNDVFTLSTEKVELSRSVGSYTVTSNAGFYLDEINQDGKTISLRTEHSDGTLLLDGGWIQVRTPESRSKELAHGMYITVTENTGDSARECKIIVHNGSKTRKVTVHQKCAADERK